MHKPDPLGKNYFMDILLTSCLYIDNATWKVNIVFIKKRG